MLRCSHLNRALGAIHLLVGFDVMLSYKLQLSIRHMRILCL